MKARDQICRHLKSHELSAKGRRFDPTLLLTVPKDGLSLERLIIVLLEPVLNIGNHFLDILLTILAHASNTTSQSVVL
jgi:hypothetical protein